MPNNGLQGARPFRGVDPEPSYDDLAGTLGALASPPRLALLRALRTPQALNEIRLEVGSPAADGTRLASRQAVAHHLDALLDQRLVRRMSEGATTRGALYMLDHQRLFALVDEVRGLARLRPAFSELDAGGTIATGSSDSARLPPRPRLVVGFGRDTGVGYALPIEGSAARIGRAPECEVCLDYDPYLSGVHATIARAEGSFVLRDNASRNGTWLNWTRVPSGAATPLAPGDLITVGRCVLSFQP